MLANQIKDYLQLHLSDMMELLKELVNCNTSSDFKPGIDAVGEKLAREFEKIGYSTETLYNDNCGNSVIARSEGNGSRVLLICHLDSVFARGTDCIESFKIEGDRAYGNGVVDMKACLVNCLYALKALHDLDVPDLPGITVFMSGDEEKGSLSVLDRIREE